MENPSFLKSNKRILKVSCGNNHMIILDSFGTMLGIGSNEYGQLGDHICENRFVKE